MATKKQIDILVKLGILIPFDNNLQLYHGRAKKSTEKDWKVDRFFDNSGNRTNNANVNRAISAIHSSTLKVAQDYAMVRANKACQEIPQVLKLVPATKETKYFLNTDVPFEAYDEATQKIILEVLNISNQPPLMYSLTSRGPANFHYRDYYEKAFDLLSPLFFKKLDTIKNKTFNSPDIEPQFYYPSYKEFITTDEINKLDTSSHMKDILFELAGTMNAYLLLQYSPVDAVKRAMEFASISRRATNYARINPFNEKYVFTWARENNLIGIKNQIRSVTIGQIVDDYLIFDKKYVESEEQHTENQTRKNRHNGLANLTKNVLNNEEYMNALKEDDPAKLVDFMRGLDITFSPSYIKRDDVVDFFMQGQDFDKTKTFSCKQLLDASAHVFPETFTIAEHTETVLRLFETSFKDRFPEELLPFIRLIFLCHDIGKGFCTEFKDRRQKVFNQYVGYFILSKLNVDQKYKDLILFVIGDSQSYAAEYMIHKNRQSKVMLEKEFAEKLEKLGFPADKDLAYSLTQIALVLQYCDGGAYTTYAVTRDRQSPDKEKTFYSNYNERFTLSFMQSDMGDIISKAEYDEENE